MDNKKTTDPMGIRELSSLHYFTEQLDGCMKKTTKPVLSDTDLIPVLYQWFKEFPLAAHGKVLRRGIFVVVIVRLFSPQTFVGKSMRNGVRNKLADTLGCYRHPQNISNLFAQTYGYYPYHADIRKDIDAVFCMMLDRVGAGT